MSEGLDYAKMVEMPSSCEVVVKHAKKRKNKADVKQEVIEKVNNQMQNVSEEQPETASEEFTEVRTAKSGGKIITNCVKEKKKRKFDMIYAEGVLVFMLVVAILLTNIFWENSGMNTLFKQVFGNINSSTQTDTRAYSSFSAASPVRGSTAVTVNEGVMTFSGTESIYPVCDGEVTAITEADGKYTVTIAHSKVFKTVIAGVDYVYAEKGDSVYKYIPVCYAKGGDIKVYMYNSDSLLTNYIVENGTIVWES